MNTNVPTPSSWKLKKSARKFTFLKKLFLLVVVCCLLALASCTKNKTGSSPTPVDNACQVDPCGNPIKCPGMCPNNGTTPITKNDITASGSVSTTDTSLTVTDGTMKINLGANNSLQLDSANVTVVYNPDGSVKYMSGKAAPPSPKDYFEFEKPVKADVGYYTGKYLNDNWGLDITLQDNRYYFAFLFSVNLELKVGANSDPNATKPISIQAPFGGHVIFIADYTDPFYYFDGEQQLLGSLGIAESYQGLIPYVPVQPVDKIIAFKGKSFKSGSFNVFKVIDVNGYMIQNQDFNVELTNNDPFQPTFKATYGAGINGTFDLTLPIASFVNFSIPMGESSAAVVASAGTGGVTAQAFLNGLAQPDNSWWPTFVPVKPNGQLRVQGYVEQTGMFNLSIAGKFGLQMPGTSEELEGAAAASNQEFKLSGTVSKNTESWQASVAFKKDSTELTATPPTTVLNNISSLVNDNINAGFAKADSALTALQDATKNYQFELSLRGLRSSLPAIISTAKQTIADAEASAIASGRSQANSILSSKGYALCSDNITSVVNSVAAPYIAALNRILNAVNETNDNAQTRTELEAALRQLAGLNTIDKTVQVTIVAGNKAVVVAGITITPQCTVKQTYYRNVTVQATVLSNSQVTQLNTAADNVKYIAETSNIMISSQQFYDQLPTKAQLTKLQQDIQSGTKKIPSIGSVGYDYLYSGKKYVFFFIADGQKKVVSQFNLFDGQSIGGAIMNTML